MKSNAACGSSACEPTASVQPPDIEVKPGSWPFCVGIAANPIVSSHSGQAPSPEIQLPGSQDPSMAIASCPWGISSAETRLPTAESRVMSKGGPSSSLYTVFMKDKESRNPCEPITHLLLSSS